MAKITDEMRAEFSDSWREWEKNKADLTAACAIPGNLADEELIERALTAGLRFDTAAGTCLAALGIEP